MSLIRIVFIGFLCVILSACGEDAPQQSSTKSPTNAAPQMDSPGEAQQPVANPSSSGAGGVSVTILPENPTSKGCLRATIRGVPGSSLVVWSVNGKALGSAKGTQLCSENYVRNDQVTVTVGTSDVGASATVSIGNSLPRIVDISSSPEELFAGVEVTVTPVAEDHDGDDVDFTYQWLINGEPNPQLTDATLPAGTFTKGDSIQVQIIPNDFYDDGPTYTSFATVVPNAPPVVTSQPPQGIESLDYEYLVAASDPDDSNFTYRLEEAPDGMTIDEKTGLIKWDLTEATPGMHTIAIIVSDPDGAEAAQEYTLTLKPGE
jgi:hypothetical protein